MPDRFTKQALLGAVLPASSLMRPCVPPVGASGLATHRHGGTASRHAAATP